MKKQVKYLKEKEALGIIKSILKGLKELKRYKIVHRDLKMSNIFLKKDKVMIGDFGIAKVGKKMTDLNGGTLFNMSPE